MSLDRDHSQTSSNATPSQVADDLAPGRSNAANQLAAPQRPLVSALIHRKARDANGVADGADVAVSAASTSSGQALPGTLMRKFESSLGADLSGVRVHTGAESQAAASAVGAKAYALGNDIHFGSGHYDPSSRDGEHLLAHEVAHTVQQGGSVGRAAQFKLEVSSAGDSHEIEADRAADAMVQGAAFSVGGASTTISRDQDRNPLTHEPTLPRPLYWDGQMEDADIVGSWAGAPQFDKIAVGDMSPAGMEWVNRVDRLKGAFTVAWFTGQGYWNGAVPAYAEYKQASQDAQNKGLVDFGGKAGQDIDTDADMADFGDKTTVSDAFSKDASKIETGKKTFDETKVAPELRRTIVTQKQAVTDAGRALEKSERGIDTAKDGLANAHSSLDAAMGALDAKKDSQNIAQLQIQIDAYKKCSALIGTTIGTMAKVKPGAGTADGAEAALQMINTFAWEAAISKIDTQVQVLQGGINQTEINGAQAMANIAQNGVKIAVRGVTDAIDDYKSKCAAVKQANATLAASLEKATTQSGGSAKTAARVRVAVEALPLMQLTLQKIQGLQSRCQVVPETEDARAGGGLTSNGQDFVHHMAVLASNKNTLTTSATMWQKRITQAQALIAQAH